MARRKLSKIQDKCIWECMGRELAALRTLIGEIQTDPDYQAAMDCKSWDRLGKMVYYLDNVRSWAENRMARAIPDWSTQTFYPIDRKEINTAVLEFRKKMKGDLINE